MIKGSYRVPEVRIFAHGRARRHFRLRLPVLTLFGINLFAFLQSLFDYTFHVLNIIYNVNAFAPVQPGRLQYPYVLPSVVTQRKHEWLSRFEPEFLGCISVLSDDVAGLFLILSAENLILMRLKKLVSLLPSFQFTVKTAFVNLTALGDGQFEAKGQRENVFKDDLLLMVSQFLHILEKFVLCRDFSVAFVMVNHLAEKTLRKPVKVDSSRCRGPPQMEMTYRLLKSLTTLELTR